MAKDFKWKQVQGYRMLTRQYLAIIKEKSLPIDDPKFVEAGILLQKNPDNLNVLITCLVENTDLFNQKSVISLFITLSEWFRMY